MGHHKSDAVLAECLVRRLGPCLFERFNLMLWAFSSIVTKFATSVACPSAFGVLRFALAFALVSFVAFTFWAPTFSLHFALVTLDD